MTSQGQRQRQGQIPRRDFLRTASAALSIPYFIPSGVLAAPGKPGANDRITLGHIGVGGMGSGHLGRLAFQELGMTNVAAVCDVDESRLANAVKRVPGSGGGTLSRLPLHRERSDIDAVVIATPDHWHAVQTVHACESGKHVYVEKPSSVTIREGQAMVKAARGNLQGAGRRSGAKRHPRLPHVPRHSQRDHRQGELGRLLALRKPSRRKPSRRQRSTSGTGLGHVVGPLAVAAVQRTLLSRHVPLVTGVGRRPDSRPWRSPVQHDSLVHGRRQPGLVHG